MSAGAGSTAVVIPALNEALRIRPVVERTLRHCPWVIAWTTARTTAPPSASPTCR